MLDHGMTCLCECPALAGLRLVRYRAVGLNNPPLVQEAGGGSTAGEDDDGSSAFWVAPENGKAAEARQSGLVRCVDRRVYS